MAESIFGNGMDQWICPNDRQLALRAKLQTGWSVHTFQSEKQRKSQSLNSDELDMIVTVIQRAERLEQVEQQRIGRLVERLENMRKNMMGNGQTQCLLCAEMFGLFGTSSAFCQGCTKKVCTKCGIETLNSQKRQQWLCKICSEQREVWKRSGAWFYKALPKYILPPNDNSRAGGKGFRLMKGDGQQAGPTGQAGQVYNWTKTKGKYKKILKDQSTSGLLSLARSVHQLMR
ncbi:rab effector Noc2-like [Erpetoichthys calabaricus]|uniref:rab effector Noc2-like n=1 Tax=Erpetoichthys calabaricus TaxID=27687 RepID=UPI00223429B4|nr:rab effector Noc2-like [Erpetoichthys calabaricus]